MQSLQLLSAIRQGGSNKTEREYLDFIISGQSLKRILGAEKADFISSISLETTKEYFKYILNVFRLKEKSELESGRVMLYVCPECGDIDCGAITAVILDVGDRIIWRDFGYETGYGGLSEKYSNIAAIEIDRQNYFEAFSKFK